MDAKQEQLIARFFDQRESSKTQKGISIFVLVELAGSVHKPNSSVARELLADGYHERVRGFCRSQDHHFAIADDRAVIVLNGITKTSQLHLAARKLLEQFEASLSIVDEDFFIECRAAFVIPSAKISRLRDLIQSAEQVLATTNSKSPYAIHKLGDKLVCEENSPSSTEIMQALDAGNFGLVVHKIQHTTYGSVVGHQTNLVWSSNEWGNITPESLKPFPEVREAVSHFHIRAAIKHLASMPENTNVELEVSPEEVCNEDFISVLADTCGFHDASPDRVRLALGRAHDVDFGTYLQALVDIGFGITLKNFGVTTNIVDLTSLPCTIVETAALPDSPVHKSMTTMIHDLGKQAHTRVHGEQIPDWVKSANYDAVTLG